MDCYALAVYITASVRAKGVDMMAIALREDEVQSLIDEVAGFAAREVACPGDVQYINKFSPELWGKIGRHNLAGLNLPVEYGGRGKSHLCAVAAGETMVRTGCNLGLAFMWIYHLVVAQLFIAGFGNTRQRKQYLPGLASGELTACLAVSEPGTGAHPKHLKTTAYREGGRFYLNGEKTYLTNGPIAELFVVIAVTGASNSCKSFTAFLVPRGTLGLSLTEPLDMPFLKDVPHCGIKLENCVLDESHVLGTEGTAYKDMVIPFRELEDIYMAGLITGGAARQLELTAGLVQERGIKITEEFAGEFADLHAKLHTLRLLAYECAGVIDSGEKHPELPYLLQAFKNLAVDLQDGIRRFTSKVGLDGYPELDRLAVDLGGMVKIAGKITYLKRVKLGREILSGALVSN